MPNTLRRSVRRFGTYGSLLCAALLLVGLGIGAARNIARYLHEQLPASTWWVAELIEPTEAVFSPDEPLFYRIRGQIHRDHDAERTAVLSCRSLDTSRSLLSSVWRQIGPVIRSAGRTRTAPMLVGYAEEELAPTEEYDNAPRRSGLEVWPGPLPENGPHTCVIAMRWTITTTAGAVHKFCARSAPFDVRRQLPGLPEPAEPVAPSPPPATAIVDEAEEREPIPVKAEPAHRPPLPVPLQPAPRYTGTLEPSAP